MNYKYIYNKIIVKAKSENRKKKSGIYYEKHHIKPKCVGGLNNKDNLVLLTAKEHFICHKLLVEIYPDSIGLKYAAFTMTIKTLEGRDYRISSREHDRLRKEFIEFKDWKDVSDKTRNKISNTLKELYVNKENHPQYGKSRSKDTKEKLSKSLSSYFELEENRNKVSLSHGGKWFNVYTVKDVIIKNRICVSGTKGDFINRYCNETQASKDLGISRSTLHRCLTREVSIIKNYIFEYEN